MRSKDVICLIDKNIELINSSEHKISVIIELLENHQPSFDLNSALHGNIEDFGMILSAISDITPYVIDALKAYAEGQKVKFIPDVNSTVNSEDINLALEYIYQILATKTTVI